MRQRRLNLRVLAETGGMPSSHAAIVMGMTTAVGKYAGVNSAAFAIALIFSFVVMYDAAGLRRAAGRQAAILNRLVEDLVHMRGMPEQRLRARRRPPPRRRRAGRHPQPPGRGPGAHARHAGAEAP